MLIRRKIQIGPKKVSQPPKKVQLGFRGFCPYFLLLTTPYVMFESKQNSNSNCSSEGRYRSNPNKYSQSPKKVWLGFRGFRTIFLLLATPYVMFEIKFLLNSQIEPKKVQLAGKKSFLVAKKSSARVQRISHHIFAVGHPLCDV